MRVTGRPRSAHASPPDAPGRRRARRAPALVLAALAGLAPGACSPDAPPRLGEDGPRPKVLVIGIDGVRPDALREAHTPHLDSLAEAGVFSELAISALPTESGPNWSSLATGVWPEKHAVVSDDLSTNRYALYPDFLTRIEREKPYLNTAVVADWPPLVTATDGGPLFSREIDRVVALDGGEMGWETADSASAAMAARILGRSDVDALFVYFGAADEVSRSTGDIGAAYIGAIRETDRHVGRILEALHGRARIQDEDWLVLVSTDHGRRSDGGHGGESMAERTIFYIASGGTPAEIRFGSNPRIVDVAATALHHMGVEAEPGALDGVVVGQVREPEPDEGT